MWIAQEFPNAQSLKPNALLLLSCLAVQIKVLYGILVLSFVALVWVALASYIRVRRHMKKAKPDEHEEIHKHS